MFLTSMDTLCSAQCERWGGRCKQRLYECFTLCWLGSLGHHSPAWVLFTALPSHEVSLPSLEQGQSSSVRPVFSQVVCPSVWPWVTVGPVKAQMAALPFPQHCVLSSAPCLQLWQRECEIFFSSFILWGSVWAGRLHVVNPEVFQYRFSYMVSRNQKMVE